MGYFKIVPIAKEEFKEMEKALLDADKHLVQHGLCSPTLVAECTYNNALYVEFREHDEEGDYEDLHIDELARYFERPGITPSMDYLLKELNGKGAFVPLYAPHVWGEANFKIGDVYPAPYTVTCDNGTSTAYTLFDHVASLEKEEKEADKEDNV